MAVHFSRGLIIVPLKLDDLTKYINNKELTKAQDEWDTCLGLKDFSVKDASALMKLPAPSDGEYNQKRFKPSIGYIKLLDTENSEASEEVIYTLLTRPIFWVA